MIRHEHIQHDMKPILEAAAKLYHDVAKGAKGQRLIDFLVNRGLDNATDGFWVYEIQDNWEGYSPKFRKTLGFENEVDFPNSPLSWQMQLKYEEDLNKSMNLFKKHVESKGEIPFIVNVTYWKKNRVGDVKLTCWGVVVEWTDDWSPVRMIGAHEITNKGLAQRR